MNNKIGILGCGWLGFPLAQAFLQDGFSVNGSTTNKDKLSALTKVGINAFVISITENEIQGSIDSFLKDVKTLVLNVPPKLRGVNKENYVAKMHLSHAAIKNSSVKNIVFVSSTAVYGNKNGVVTEKTVPEPYTESGKQLLESENIFLQDDNLQTTIIRFGGLISEDRHPVTMLSQRENLQNGMHPVNLIHRNDCIRIIQLVINENLWSEIINGVYPKHPAKKEYYKNEANKRGLKPPIYLQDSSGIGKTVQANYLLNVKKFSFHTSIGD